MTSAVPKAWIEQALDRVPARELPLLVGQLTALHQARRPPADDMGPYLALLRREDVSGPLKVAVGLARLRCLPSIDAASAVRDGQDESRVWAERAKARMRPDGPAALSRPTGQPPGSRWLLPELPDGRFVQLAHETMLGRGCQPHELVRWRERLEHGEVSREGLLEALHDEARRVAERDAARLHEPETGFHVMGTGRRVTEQNWQERAQELAREPAGPRATASTPPLHLRGSPRLRISAITSLYAGGEHIGRFLENMVGQTIFAEYAELIFIDANSPDGEQAVIERYQRRWPNIRYVRLPEQVGIYEAWNLALNMARGEYLTSANVDDLRRSDSLEQQAALLEQLPFVDVVYQDFFYTLDPTLSFDEAAAFGFKSDLPLVTPQGLMALNPPHNAPMWRRRLHDELGLFDTTFQSAGDYDFWMRCVLAGKTFFKLNEPHVVYYQNPRGLSTRPGTRGHEETREVHRRYGRQLVSENLVMQLEEFRARVGLGAASTGAAAKSDRQAIVRRALLACAGAAPWPEPGGNRDDRPLRVLVDGIEWSAAAAADGAWARLATALARDVGVEFWWLDRGQAPELEGLRRIPFPGHRKGACAADSLLVQKVCDLKGIDVFLSTGVSTPVATPTLMIIDARDRDHDVNADSAAPALRERELARAFARGFLCTSEAARDALLRHRPAPPPAAIRVLAGSNTAPRQPAATGWSSEPLLAAGRELRAQRPARACAAFFAEWRRLRELQASIDF
jgi:GT2 family glycosyltransferase